MPWTRALIAIAVVGAHPWAAAAGAHIPAWPRLQGERSEVCQDALSLGRQAFRSTEPSLPDPASLPPAGGHSQRLLGARPPAGEAFLAVDDAAFETIAPPGPGPERRLYWQRQATQVRIVVDESAFGSQGHQYVLYVLPQEVSQSAFRQEWERPGGPSSWQPFLEGGGWRPIAVWRAASGSDWWLDTGEPSDFLAPWRVFTLDRAGAYEACRIVFRPAGTTGVALLPAPVRHLEGLLDRSMGQDPDEGSYRPIAQLRFAARQTWTNVALRPWALGASYNTPAEADSGLAAWAASRPANRRLRAEIEADMPVAREALARYYRRTFPQAAAQAERSAAFAIDVALRSHYAFHADAAGQRPRGTSDHPNPWRPPGDR